MQRNILRLYVSVDASKVAGNELYAEGEQTYKRMIACANVSVRNVNAHAYVGANMPAMMFART